MLIGSLLVSLLRYIPQQWVWPLSAPYIAGITQAQALQTTHNLCAQGYRVTLDVLGEFVSGLSQTELAYHAYVDLLQAMAQEAHWAHPQANVSIKLSQLGLLLDANHCQDKLQALAQLAQQTHSFVRIDMEDSPCTDKTLAIYRALRQQHLPTGIVLQARLRRTQQDLAQLLQAQHAHIRLCKGIYLEPRAIAYTQKTLINQNYLALLEQFLQAAHTAGYPPHYFVGIATHDEAMVFGAEALLKRYNTPRENYEFQLLLGVDTELRQIIRDAGHPVRVYVPFGAQWHAYGLRRLRENPLIAQHIARQSVQRLLKRTI